MAKMDNPRIKQKGPVERGLKEAGVKGPRSFKGSDFRDFPKLVVQMNGPRPRPQRVDRPEPPPGGAGAPEGPQQSFARPLRGMGLGGYEGGREAVQPQMDAYRTAVHSAYDDGTLTPEERTGLRQQRRGIRTDVRSYKRQHPLQMGLGAKLGLQKQEGLQQVGGVPTQAGHPASPPDLQRLRQEWEAGRMTPQQILEALGFTGLLPHGGGSNG